MLKICSLYSGSSGNSIYVECGKTKLLVDAGVSCKRIEQALSSIGVSVSELTGILVTHEHSDHVSSVGIVHRKCGAKIFANENTFAEVSNLIGKYDEGAVNIFDGAFSIGDVAVTPFAIPHDAVSPVGYTFSDGISKIAIATDIGHITDEIKSHILGSDICLLEANHDVEMLKSGPYPYPLKQRILSDVGHLSNENAGLLCGELIDSGTKDIILGHLSKTNNHPDLAYVTVKSVLEEGGFKMADCNISVASSEMPGEFHSC